MDIDITIFLIDNEGPLRLVGELRDGYTGCVIAPSVGDEIHVPDDVWDGVNDDLMSKFYDEQIVVKDRVIYFSQKGEQSISIFCDITRGKA